MAVELLRSCYSGRWRLFRDRPDIVTEMRYYFVADDTPVYEGWHNYASANWTKDREAPYVPPLLGEDASLPTVYSKGDLGTVHPPATLLGSADCVAGGETYPPAVQERRMIAGIDSRCWSERGLPLPDQVPKLFLTDDNILPSVDGVPVTRWKDASVYNLPVDIVSQPSPPVAAIFGGHRWVGAQFGQSLRIRSAIAFTDDWALLVVAEVMHLLGPAPARVVLGAFDIDSSPLAITPTQVRVWPGLGPALTFPNPVGYTGKHLWSIRSEGSQLAVHLDGDQLGTAEYPPGAAFRLTTATGDIAAGAGVVVALTGFVKLFDAWVSADQYAAEMAAAKALYGIP